MSLLITGATLLDGVSEVPIDGHSIWLESGRIKRIGPKEMLDVPPGVQEIDASGKYVIPGLMNANVHLLIDVRLENLARHADQYEGLIAEAAQVALKNGVTTVFDTWGPRRALMAVRDRIASGEETGSRIFCVGNIIGLDGPYSQDFVARVAEIASPAMVKRINATWAENVGRHLLWQTAERAAMEVRDYIAKGIDFIKYAANDHFPGSFIAFSPRAQANLVREAHRAGIAAQAHCMNVEGLHIALEAGCDLITHCNITGPVPIPQDTLDEFVKRKVGAVIFPWTDEGLAWVRGNVTDAEWTMWEASDINVRNLIDCDASLMLATDGGVVAPEALNDPLFTKNWMGGPEKAGLFPLATGHFYWLKAMEEKGCAPMRMLQAATRNIAEAYGKGRELGTLEQGKIADLLVLDRNPLESAEHYRSIHAVIKDGALVDRASLPLKPILTRPLASVSDEEKIYTPFLSERRLPMCMCSRDRN